MSKALDDLYLTWLYRQIGDMEVADPSQTYHKLAHLLFTKEFVWFVPNDDNRVEDGRCLRYEFIEDLGLDEDIDPHWLDVGCSMLELMIGLSRRLSFHGEGEPRDWFWLLVKNLGLRYDDRKRLPVAHIHDVLDGVIWRTYRPSGHGGFFPLALPDEDQRDVEIWYQLSAFLLERS